MVEKVKKVLQRAGSRELLKGSALALALRVAGFGLGYVFTLVVARFFGAEANGYFSLSVVTLMLLTILCRLGLDTALVKLVAQHKVQNNMAYIKGLLLKSQQVSFLLSIVVGVGLYLLSPFLAVNLYDNEGLILPFRAVAIAVPFWTLVTINAGFMRGLKRVVSFSVYMHVARFALPLLACVVVLVWAIPHTAAFPSVAYAAATVLIMFFSLGQILLYFKKSAKGIKAQQVPLKGLLTLSTPMLLSSSMFYILEWTDSIVLGIYSTEDTVGIYYVAIKLATITSFSLTAINTIAAPKFSELYNNGQTEAFKKELKQTSKLMFWVSLPALLLTLLIPDTLMGLFGPEYKGYRMVLIIITLSQFVNVVCGPVGYVLQMTGRQTAFFYILTISAVINVTLNFVLAPAYGMLGVATATLISRICWNVISAVYAYKKLGFKSFYLPFIGS